MTFSEEEVQRYSRHILLAEVGGTGQAALRAARVLVVGAGGLGCPVVLYLAAAGVGTLGVVDDDVVELSNLQRQIAHGVADLGAGKVDSAIAAGRAVNPLVNFVPHVMRVDEGNAAALVAGYDVVCDGTDNFPARAALAAACFRAGVVLVSAAVLRFEGQLAMFGPGSACYRCLYPEAPPAGVVTSCAQAGVLGAVTGVMGTLQATEVLKLLLGVGETLAGRLLMWDALAMRFRMVRLRRDPACSLCGGTGKGDVPRAPAVAPSCEG